ncbi:hypothetical protein BD779DRAFT_1674999 [Infundibulicybe gibba]|nr:hypothetical protein BD779DRAFT_1674999 [Infundibulicybe gibba]
MKFLVFVLTLFLFSSIASADVLNDIIGTRRKILQEFYEADDSKEFGTNVPKLRAHFTSLTVDRLMKVVKTNVIVVHGEYELTDVKGQSDGYNVSINIGKKHGEHYKYAVILLDGGKFTMKGEGGLRNVRVGGNCQPNAEERVWICEKRTRFD